MDQERYLLQATLLYSICPQSPTPHAEPEPEDTGLNVVTPTLNSKPLYQDPSADQIINQPVGTNQDGFQNMFVSCLGVGGGPATFTLLSDPQNGVDLSAADRPALGSYSVGDGTIKTILSSSGMVNSRMDNVTLIGPTPGPGGAALPAFAAWVARRDAAARPP